MIREAKKSYLGFPCGHCHSPVVALSIRVEMSTPSFEKKETIQLECPSCHHAAEYELSHIRRFEQHQLP